MTPKAMLFDSQTAALLRPWRESGEKSIRTRSTESDPDWGRSEDRFIVFEPEEIEVLNFDEVKVDLGLDPSRDEARGSSRNIR